MGEVAAGTTAAGPVSAFGVTAGATVVDAGACAAGAGKAGTAGWACSGAEVHAAKTTPAAMIEISRETGKSDGILSLEGTDFAAWANITSECLLG